MKNASVLIIGLSLLFYCNIGLCNLNIDNQNETTSKTSANNTLNIMSSPELYNLTVNWVTEYEKFNPSIKINISKTFDNQSIESNKLSFISDSKSVTINNENAWKMVIGRDAIVQVINSGNPMLNSIHSQGISAEKLTRVLSDYENQNWNVLVSGGQTAQVHFYITDNEEVKAAITNWTKTNSTLINGIKEATASELVSSVQKDIYAIGLCKQTDVRNAITNEIIENIKLVPIDKNRNGRIDNFENIYDNLDTFTRGVWIGKYPHELCGSIYAVSSSRPDDKNVLAFLSWISTDGQKYLNPNGYSNLVSTETLSNLATLASMQTGGTQIQKHLSSGIWLLIILAFVIIASTITAIVLTIRYKKSNEFDEDIKFAPAFNEDSIIAPKGIYFDKTHTWAFMEKDGMVKVGIDDFLQHITGTLTRIKMKGPGEMVRKGEKILTIIREGKQLNIYSPVSGTITEQNQKLLADSSIINSSPYTDGWVYLIEPKNWLREIQFLILGDNYQEWLQDEFTRLKDFFATSVRSNTAVYEHIILQDGGELNDHILADLEPEVWEDFQTKFIDTSK